MVSIKRPGLDIWKRCLSNNQYIFFPNSRSLEGPGLIIETLDYLLIPSWHWWRNFFTSLLFKVSHKKIYLMCQIYEFPNITKYLSIFKQLSLLCWLSQWLSPFYVEKNQNKRYFIHNEKSACRRPNHLPASSCQRS